MLVLLLLAQLGSGPNLMLEPPGLNPDTAAQLEQTLVSDPENLDLRMRLVRYYFLQAMAPQRAEHIFWMIEHHPESNLHSTRNLFLRPWTDALNTPAPYEQGRQLWTKAVERHPENGAVLITAARYIFNGDPFEAEKLWFRARRIPAMQEEATRDLVGYYSGVTFAELAVGVRAVFDPHPPAPEFRKHVLEFLFSTKEAIFPGRVGLSMVRPITFRPNSPPPPEAVELYQRLNEYGIQLIQRAQALEPANPEWRLPAHTPR
ncbi:MAG: hypothetical protein ABI972_02780 [Acidobacteriota bacterium]